MKKATFLLTAVAGVATVLGAGVAAAQDIYVSDSLSDSLTIIAPGGSETTLSSPLLNDPTGLAFDGSGNLYIANSGNGTITEYSTLSGTFSTFATGLVNPRGLAFDSTGNLYVANNATSGAGGGIDKFTFSGGILSSSPGSYASPLNLPSGIAIDAFGDLYVSVSGNQLARIAPGGGAASTNLFSVPTDPLNGPNGVTFGPNGDLYVVNTGAPNVEQVTLSLKGSTSVASVGQGLSTPQGLIFDDNGDLWVADYGNNSVTEYGLVPNTDGIYTLIGSYTTGFDGPSFLAIGPSGPAVPEPGTYALLLGGLAALYFYQRRRVSAPIRA